MKGDRPLTDFIKTNGIYQSTVKLSGEIHAACFMFGKHYTYMRFRENSELIEIFNSQYDLRRLRELKLKVKPLKITDTIKSIKMQKENWEDGTFKINASLNSIDIKSYLGHFRTDILGQDELLIIQEGDQNNTDVYTFIEFNINKKIEFEILNLFTNNNYLKVNNGLPNFGNTEIEISFAFNRLENLKYITPSGTHHLDCYDYIRTEEGDKYYNLLKSQYRIE